MLRARSTSNGKPARLRGGSPAWPLLGAQIATTVVAALLGWLSGGETQALAAAFGGVVVIGPTAWFAVKSYSPPGQAGPAQIVGNMYRAEVGKLALTAALFWLGAVLFGNHFAPLMLTAIACLSMNWWVLGLSNRAKRGEL